MDKAQIKKARGLMQCCSSLRKDESSTLKKNPLEKIDKVLYKSRSVERKYV